MRMIGVEKGGGRRGYQPKFLGPVRGRTNGPMPEKHGNGAKHLRTKQERRDANF